MTRHPQVRQRRLNADLRKMSALDRSSDFIEIEHTEGHPPEKYRVLYTCKGVIAPGFLMPVLGEEHRVLIELPFEYPTKPPHIRWLSPIFHPNISKEGTQVCIDIWYPSKFLDDLCVMLGRMIQYKNYNHYSPLRSDAAEWAHHHQNLLPVDRRPLKRSSTEHHAVDEFEIRIL